MLTPFARAVTYYLGGGFALALLCAAFSLDRPIDGTAAWRRSARRRASILIPLGLAHPVLALAALALARDGAAPPFRLLLPTATASLVTSVTIMSIVLVATA